MSTSLLATATGETWIGVALAALNVVQTIALAYLAAHKFRNGRA